jgi:hypothetical protein
MVDGHHASIKGPIQKFPKSQNKAKIGKKSQNWQKRQKNILKAKKKAKFAKKKKKAKII